MEDLINQMLGQMVGWYFLIFWGPIFLIVVIICAAFGR
jgi:hypothetical protein